jgi:hypothetical protein
MAPWLAIGCLGVMLVGRLVGFLAAGKRGR